jgi:putative phosphoribosyl transferase
MNDVTFITRGTGMGDQRGRWRLQRHSAGPPSTLSSQEPTMIPVAVFRDRYDAGQRLGTELRSFANDRPLIVLGLPRGGVPVAGRIADALQAPLDVFVVRKLGVPGHEEVAMGAIASGGTQVLNRDVIQHFDVSQRAIDRVIAAERRELERRETAYRDGRRLPVLVGETVIVVDDGAATGASMRVAVHALRQLGARKIVAAVPVASSDAVETLDAEADACVALVTPEPFYGVGAWYGDFSETTDAEVRSCPTIPDNMSQSA